MASPEISWASCSSCGPQISLPSEVGQLQYVFSILDIHLDPLAAVGGLKNSSERHNLYKIAVNRVRHAAYRPMNGA